MDKPFEWNEEKNLWLKQNRGFGFEDIVVAIDGDGLLDIVRNQNPKFAHQDVFYVIVSDYVIAVPYIEDEDKIFLKTAFPSRKAQRKYLEL